MFFPIQQWPCHNNIVTDKGLSFFDDSAAECVYLCPQEEECTSSSWGYSKIYTPGTIADLQADRALTKINKKRAVVGLRILVELGIL